MRAMIRGGVRPPGRAARAVAAVLGAGLLAGGLAACSSTSSAPPAAVNPSERAKAQQPPAKDLSRFYKQRLKWTACGDDRCTRLTVPIDYDKPDGATIALAVLDVPALSSSKRVGALVVNPGGPGASGVDYAAAAPYVASRNVREVYDIVGFDPRGVARSSPVNCYDGAQMDAYLASDPTPDDKAEEKAMIADGRSFGQACAAHTGNLLGHVSTVEAAKDMDVLRAALGESRLDYLGKSYGTYLGAIYAGLFPKRVGHFVLDGVVAPDLSASQVDKGQAEGFERATRAYVQHCVGQGNCVLGGSVDEGMQRLREFVKHVDAHPLKVTDDARVTQLTEGWASMGIAQAMYDQVQWDDLSSALRAAFGGNGDPLMVLADAYARRDRNGAYQGNLLQAISAVNCLDRPQSHTLGDYERKDQDFSKVAPTWGPFLAWGSSACADWPVPPTGKPHKVTAAGSGPILVVGTTRDPATPYQWSVRLAKELDNGHLLTFNGDGHTAYMRSNACLDDAVDGYLLHDSVPAEGTTC